MTNTFTTDDSTSASRPGKITVHPLRWIERHPKWPIILLSSLLLMVLGAMRVHAFYWIFAFLLFLFNGLYWMRIREHFLYGDGNPGLVISIDPLLIAVYTDLSKGRGHYPVIKIIQEKPSKRFPQPTEIGSHVATVALYKRGDNDASCPHWADFNPLAVEPVTDIRQSQQLHQRFQEKDWNKIKQGMKSVPSATVGLYKINSTNSHW